jgi:hypothetical protein
VEIRERKGAEILRTWGAAVLRPYRIALRRKLRGALLWSQKNDHYPWGKSLHG